MWESLHSHVARGGVDRVVTERDRSSKAGNSSRRGSNIHVRASDDDLEVILPLAGVGSGSASQDTAEYRTLDVRDGGGVIATGARTDAGIALVDCGRQCADVTDKGWLLKTHRC